MHRIYYVFLICYCLPFHYCNGPLSSDRQYLSYDVCLAVRGDYQNCSMLYCLLKLCTVIITLR